LILYGPTIQRNHKESVDCVNNTSMHAVRHQRSPNPVPARKPGALKKPGHRSRGRTLRLPCPHHTIPGGGKEGLITRGPGPLSAQRLQRLAQPWRRV